MKSLSLVLQKALHQKLSAALREGNLREGKAVKVYDGAPPEAAFPYVTIGEGRVRIEALDQISLYDHLCDVFVFSQHTGISETKEILETIYDVLAGDDPLSIDGHHLTLLTITEMRFQSMSDGKTWRGQLTFRALTEPETKSAA